MKQRNLIPISLLVWGLLALFAVATSSADDNIVPRKITTITIPGNLPHFDISWVDSASETYYLADRTSTPGTGRVEVIDAEHDTFLYSITGFVGNAGSGLSGPDGVLVIHKRNELWAGDGDSTVKVVDLATGSVVTSIPTGGDHRADELAYDPVDQVILVANDRDAVPFVTFISVETRTVLGHISYPQATAGLEQPVWDQQRHRFYMSVPATVANPNGEVDEINPKTESVTNVFPITTPCGPAGLALLPGQRLMTSCGVVLDARTGATLATIAGVSGDEIWYNPGDNRVYFGNQPIFVVDATSYQVIASIDVGDTHSLAANSENNHIFVPVTGVGVVVYADDEDQEGHGRN